MMDGTEDRSKEGQPGVRFDKIRFEDLNDESEWARLGKGSFGSVYKGEYLSVEVAIKEVLPSTEYDVEKYLAREISLMQQARHPNVVQYLGLCLAPPSVSNTSPRPRILIVSEYLPRGNLRQFILNRSLPLPWRLRVSFAIDIARSIAYLHARNAMHRDLKGENLLVTSNERLKICDFGLARVAPSGGAENEEWKRMTLCGTDGYMSPEILLGQPFDIRTDIFSLGVLLVEIASRQLASQHQFVRQLPDYGISAEEVWSSVSPNAPTSFVELALECCSTDPNKRPDAKAILRRLRDVELEVAQLEAQGLGGADAHSRGRTNSAAANVGSVSFAGTTKRGSIKHANGLGRGSTRPSAPRLPSFEGQINLRLGSSFVSSSCDLPDLPSSSGPGHTALLRGHARTPASGGQTDDEDDDEALLTVVDADVPIDSLDMRPDSAYFANLRAADTADDATDYSTSVVKPSSRIIASRIGASGPYGRLGSSSGSNLFAQSDSSLPRLPPGWISASEGSPASNEAGEEEGGGAPTLIAPTPPRLKEELEDSASFLTARTSTLSVAEAVVGGTTPEEDEEERDVFHLTLQHVTATINDGDVPHEAPHRFSLIRPGLQRFFGSFVPSPSASFADHSAGLGAANKRATWEAGSASPSQPTQGRCGQCEKKLGLMKAYLSCDDCGLSVHIKCSDIIPPTCRASASAATTPTILSPPLSPASPSFPAQKPQKPTRVAPPPPSSAQNRPSKLFKKQRGESGGAAQSSSSPLTALNT
ncbi:LIM domain kinase 1 [Rhodotorula toruloides]|uniref:LIM domain kinase 1 n=1 Tax=Rhodotorula toruloides TaxID=5286 RepID=A0A511KMC2_RHOTO|nr:LIM domain kinase 1 [Rhodotorula toruloides]